MPNPVVHFEVTGQDGPGLIKFYGDAFDWKIDADNPMNYGMVDPGSDGIKGGVAGSQEGQGSTVTFYVQVDDLDATLKKIESLGGKTVNPPMDVPGGPTLAHFQDPAGNFVGLLKAGSMG